MAVGMIDTQNLTDIANAIRSKIGSSDTFKPSEMASAITNIPSETVPNYTGSYSVTVSANMTIPINGKKATSDISLTYDMTQINEAQTVANQISALVG